MPIYNQSMSAQNSKWVASGNLGLPLSRVERGVSMRQQREAYAGKRKKK